MSRQAACALLLPVAFPALAAAPSLNGGLFWVARGGGQIVDGSGPGTFALPADLFRDRSGVRLEVTIANALRGE